MKSSGVPFHELFTGLKFSLYVVIPALLGCYLGRTVSINTSRVCLILGAFLGLLLAVRMAVKKTCE